MPTPCRTRRIFLMGVGGLLGCARGSAKRLNVYNWSNYVGPNTITTFEREFGVKVRYSTYESNEEMLAKVFSGNSGWDVVFPSNHCIQPMINSELLAPLRHGLLGNLAHLSRIFNSPEWDPSLSFSVPYMWGSTGIIYNRSASPPPRSWSDMWSDQWRGRMTMLDDPADVLGACLKKNGHSINSTLRDQLYRARAEAIVQKRLLRAYVNAEVRDQLVAGDVLCSQLWATSSQQAIRANGQLAYVYPSEGFGLYADNAAILRESRRQEMAHAFINYLLRPEVAADIGAAVETATANGDALQLLPEEVRLNMTLYPPDEVLRRGEWFSAMPVAAQRLRDRLWTEIKSA